jgi:predicted HNH restriction endonuclease
LVFASAATLALGYEVTTDHFKGGEHTPCFRILRDAGYEVERKPDAQTPAPSQRKAEPPIPSTPEDRTWAEGDRKKVVHLKKERSREAVKAKRAMFRDEHGKLYCERCGLDPCEEEGALGEACIEVHHVIPLAEADEAREVSLDDLQLLCANCHRIVHREMREVQE